MLSDWTGSKASDNITLFLWWLQSWNFCGLLGWAAAIFLVVQSSVSAIWSTLIDTGSKLVAWSNSLFIQRRYWIAVASIVRLQVLVQIVYGHGLNNADLLGYSINRTDEICIWLGNRQSNYCTCALGMVILMHRTMWVHSFFFIYVVK